MRLGLIRKSLRSFLRKLACFAKTALARRFLSLRRAVNTLIGASELWVYHVAQTPQP